MAGTEWSGVSSACEIAAHGGSGVSSACEIAARGDFPRQNPDYKIKHGDKKYRYDAKRRMFDKIVALLASNQYGICGGV